MNTYPHKKLKRGFGNHEIESLLPETGDLLENGETADFPLHVWREWLEDDLFVKPPDGSGRKNR